MKENNALNYLQPKFSAKPNLKLRIVKSNYVNLLILVYYIKFTSVHAKKSVRKFRKILSKYLKIFSSKGLRGLNSIFGISERRC